MESIYANYHIYYQGEGKEQKVFDSGTGRTLSRSDWLLDCIGSQRQLPQTGRALDIGCGNGSFLRAFGTRYRGWKLNGTEFDRQHKMIIENIPQFENLHIGPLSELSGTYNFISLIHVLEHIAEPARFLREVAVKLEPEGTLFVELPSFETNPFELLIADHATHFTFSNIASLLRVAGFGVGLATTQWVPKEISLLLRKEQYPLSQVHSVGSIKQVENALKWLYLFLQWTREFSAKTPNFGIFGTSIAGTWLASSIENPPLFFVDEDIYRIGNFHLNKPIYSAKEIPSGSTVLIAQPQPIAEKISRRLHRRGINFISPDIIVPSDNLE